MSHKQVISYAIAKTRKDVDVDHTGILFCNSLQLFSFKVTGKSFSEALILESVDLQYDERLFIEFLQKYKFTTQACRPWHTQILADQLTLFQPGGTDYAHQITTGTPGFSDLLTALTCCVQILF